MKWILVAATVVVSLTACGDSNTKASDTATTDTTDHSAHQPGGTATTPQTTDTSGMAGKSMMSVMNSMMGNMKAVPSTGNPDNDFAALMKAHHMGAIEMAQLEVARGADPQITGMAQKMIDDQQREVAAFNTFLTTHQAHGGGDAFFKEAMKSMNDMKMEMDHSGSIDKQFVQMMIPHHQSAVDMSKAYIRSGAHEEKLKTMANSIIASQEKEIGELKAWLAKNQ